MNEVRVLLSAVLLAMGVSAAVSAGFVRYADDTGPRIVTVRLAELAADHVLQASGSGRFMDGNGGTALVSPEYDLERTRAWAASLEMALDTVAARNGAVLLPARAVAAGAVDVTGEVRTELTRLSQTSVANGFSEVRP
ncbi:MAG: TrbI F-type domain-containing protein [Gammaproteobacteria bacterium]|nr:TrbI F-type domain-containing protein [Gammaproteobacteria bacterium]